MKRLFIIFALLVGIFVIDTSAQAQAVPESQSQIKLSFAPVVKRSAPSVVNIYAKRVVQRRVRSGLFADPLFEQFFNRSLGGRFGGLTKERVENSLGSGVLIQGDGLIVTSAHVISGASEVQVALSDGRTYDAEIILIEERTDLAVLRIKADEELPYLKIGNSEALEVGDLVLAMGNPFGVGQTVTSGIVSANARTNTGISDMSFFIQTDAAINPGNSGGALVNLDGELVGVNTAIFSRDGGSLGIGFAIPSVMVKTVVNAALSDGVIKRPWFGALTQNLTSDIAESLDLRAVRGAMITRVLKDSPADDAGLKVGDVILSVNEADVIDTVGLKFRIATLPFDQKAILSYWRDGDIRKASFEPVTAPDKPARDTTLLEGRHLLNGVTVSNINPALSEELGIEMNDDEFVIVSDIQRGSPSLRIGLRKGDIILKINKNTIQSVDDLEGVIDDNPYNEGWNLILRRNGRNMSVFAR